MLVTKSEGDFFFFFLTEPQFMNFNTAIHNGFLTGLNASVYDTGKPVKKCAAINVQNL